MDTTVPPDVQKSIGKFKDQLVEISDAILACASTASSAASVEQYFAQSLGPLHPDRPTAPKEETATNIFGRNARASVTSPKPGFVFVELSFGITCGTDSLLLLYQRTNDRWERVLRWQSKQYAETKDAFGDFFHYSLINDAKTNQLTAIAAHGHPWCTSRWSGFDIDVLSLSDNADPKPVFHQNLGYVREEPTRWSTLEHGVELRAENSFLDVAVMTKKAIFRFVLEDGKLRRVQPIALNGIGFVDERLQSDWDDAKQWTSSEHAESLRTLHDKVRSEYEHGTQFGYGAVRGCSEKGIFEAELTKEEIPTYLTFRQQHYGFIMLDSSAQQTCFGEDIRPNADYFPIQNVEKIRLSTSSGVVWPVIASSGRNAE
jgi:hypothetical protein